MNHDLEIVESYFLIDLYGNFICKTVSVRTGIDKVNSREAYLLSKNNLICQFSNLKWVLFMPTAIPAEASYFSYALKMKIVFVFLGVELLYNSLCNYVTKEILAQNNHATFPCNTFKI